MTVYVVGGGPGTAELLTVKGRELLDAADRVYASPVYGELLGVDAEPSTRGSHGEVAREAAELSRKGRDVALLGSGDPGVYGKADLVIRELRGRDVDIEVVPGVTAASAASAALGAPFAGDLCAVSLSGSRPRDTVERRLVHGLRGGFSLALYNPHGHWDLALELLRRERGGRVAVVREASRPDESAVLYDAEDPELDAGFDATALVVSPDESVEEIGGFLVTDRGGHS